MATDTYKPTYWNKRGKYQKQYNILWKKYIPTEGNKIRTGDKQATNALLKLLKISNKYSKFYDDGDSFTVKGKYFSGKGASNADLKILDQFVDEIILNAWKKTKRAKLPSYTIETPTTMWEF
jgi:hypothetical protein